MLADTIRRLRCDRKAVSNVIIVMLSLVLVVIVVSNVVLWSYQMNQLDWEKMQEKIVLTEVEKLARSPWFTSQAEYSIVAGIRLGGSYVDTETIDDIPEVFAEEGRGLNLTGEFNLDLTTYQALYVQSIELQLRYRANSSMENLYLLVYNWTSGQYSDSGFNSTVGSVPTPSFSYYSVSVGSDWHSYFQNGIFRVKLFRGGNDANPALVDVDFLGVRLVVNGLKFKFENSGSLTTHIVAVWAVNASSHEKYATDFYINSGATAEYFRGDMQMDTNVTIFKAVTERGNIVLFAG